MKKTIQFSKYSIALLAVLTIATPCYAAETSGAFGAIFAVLAVTTIIVTVALGYLFKKLVLRLNLQLANWILYLAAFIISFTLLCILL